MTNWLKSWLGSSGHPPASTPREALEAAQASHPGLTTTRQRRDLGEALFADLAPKLPHVLRRLFESGRAVIGEVGIRSPAAFANALPSGGYWVEVYSGLGPFFEAAAQALYWSMGVFNADGTVTEPGIKTAQSDSELANILRAYAAKGELLEPSARLPAPQADMAGRLAMAARRFVVAHELGHLIKWEADKSTSLTAEGEIAADKLGLSISFGMLKQNDLPIAGDDIVETYAGAEFALRLFSALNALGFDFQADALHPYPKDRLETLRSLARDMLGAMFDFIFVSRLAFSHDLILQRMEESVAGRKPGTGISITSAIQGVATLTSWIGGIAATGSPGPEKAARQFEGIYEKTTGETRAEIARDLAKTYTDAPIAGGDSTVRLWRREKEVLDTVLPHLSVDCRKWIEDALTNARNEKPGQQDAAARTHNKLNARFTSDFSDKASAIAGSPLQYQPAQEAVNALVKPDAPDWVEGTPDVSGQTIAADGLIRIPSRFAFYATLEEHHPECQCGCQGAAVVTFMLPNEQVGFVARAQARNMIWSAAAGSEDNVLRYLNDGVDIESEYDGGTALMLAAQQGQLRIVELLLNRGASIGTMTSDGRSAIFFAAGRGNSEVLRLLLKRGAEANVCDDDGQTPLMYAAMNGHLESVELLLECGASSETKSRSGWTALMYARNTNASEVVKCLEARGPRR